MHSYNIATYCYWLQVSEGRGHALARVCVDIDHGMYVSVIRPSVENAPFHRGEGMIMVVRASYCRWDVSCESQPYGGPSPQADLVR